MMSRIFANCSKLNSINIASFDTKNVIYMKEMFYGCKCLTSLNLNNFDTSNVEIMSSMFYYCNNLEFLDISSFTTKISNISYLDIFDSLAYKGKILVNQDFLNKIRNQIPNNWEIIIK